MYFSLKNGNFAKQIFFTLKQNSEASVKAEIITIGDEILYGQIVDTNSQWISNELDKIGIKTIRKTAIGDQASAIKDAITEASQRASIILVTGGLGPTKDDITKKTLTELTNDHLVLNDHALQFIQAFFEQRGRKMTELNTKQAEIPSKATYLHNARGTAPGMWLNFNKSIIVSMPGVPSEMKWLMENAVLPKIKEEFKTDVFVHRIIRTIGIGESFLADLIEEWEDALPPNIKLAYLPGKMQVKLRLTAFGSNKSDLENEIEEQISKLIPLAGKYIFATSNLELEDVLGQMLKERNETISVAESCTGGFISHLLTSISGSSSYFTGSVIAYDNAVKESNLGVKRESLKAHGAVSEEVIIQMAEGVRERLNTTYGVATSGIAGPGGGTPTKPVGTLWLACAGPNGTQVVKEMMLRDRASNIEYASLAALNLVRKCIIEDQNG